MQRLSSSFLNPSHAVVGWVKGASWHGPTSLFFCGASSPGARSSPSQKWKWKRARLVRCTAPSILPLRSPHPAQPLSSGRTAISKTAAHRGMSSAHIGLCWMLFVSLSGDGSEGHFHRGELAPAQGPSRDSLLLGTIPGEVMISAQNITPWTVSVEIMHVLKECNCFSDKSLESYEAGCLHLGRAGQGLYFQLMLQPEKAACCGWNEITGFLLVLTPELTFKCIFLSSNNFL